MADQEQIAVLAALVTMVERIAGLVEAIAAPAGACGDCPFRTWRVLGQLPGPDEPTRYGGADGPTTPIAGVGA